MYLYARQRRYVLCDDKWRAGGEIVLNMTFSSLVGMTWNLNVVCMYSAIMCGAMHQSHLTKYKINVTIQHQCHNSRTDVIKQLVWSHGVYSYRYPSLHMHRYFSAINRNSNGKKSWRLYKSYVHKIEVFHGTLEFISYQFSCCVFS